ncbi:nicotinate-nicotinamide nucleotide adenylyltransferase [Lonsdalea iberica]|uniref:Probable nicotinate-nucleotide adenylyltransferase n=1 Tax=Lonsdalea iberica TaxID=1082703 RepID=A0A1X3RTT1_9GAMM|nr:nicotinate-nucleotide adenylyltransferase [Lonsdalea iberica]OSN05298.1 nicotinate-nicotinamide nucleotide adenylyltransferase [Lonsdalea iberica]OSN11878.1 nicotinate-nicotinamide nucleotide adenylyltransferase [Lonsdalea iberica]
MPIPDTTSELTAYFGGTFDPIHFGHLRPVAALAAEVGLQQVVLLPNNVPPHREQPEADARQRKEMAALAIANNPLFRIDDRELRRETPSYTIETLEALRREAGPTTPLAFIIGQDSLLTLHRWHRWQEILSYCHLLVCARPGYSRTLETPELQQWLTSRHTTEVSRLHQHPHGLIYLANTPLLPISATEIRQRRQQGRDCSDLLPAPVLNYIDTHGLYR